MTEHDRQRLVPLIRKELKKSHIPGVAEDTGLSDANLRRHKKGKGMKPRMKDFYIDTLCGYFGIDG